MWQPPPTGDLEFWRGIGRGTVDVVLIAAAVLIVLAVLGHDVLPRWGAKGRSGTSLRDQPRYGDAPDHEQPHQAAAAVDTQPPQPRAPRTVAHASEAHLEALRGLNNSRMLQGATVVLIVFAVLILGFNGILTGAEAATILAGITGYVLGKAHDQAPQAPRNGDTGATAGGLDAAHLEVRPPPDPKQHQAGERQSPVEG
jgi:hypothetical protein